MINCQIPMIMVVDRQPINKSYIKPGSGWTRLNGAVWEHVSGVRVHISGRLVRDRKKEIVVLNDDQNKLLDAYIYANGGNLLRGMLAFARRNFVCNI
jgi:hypothetical protein